MPKDSLLDELNDLEGKKDSSTEPKKDEPKAEVPKDEPKADEPKPEEPKPEEPKDKPKAAEPKIDDASLDIILKMMDGDNDAARKGIADLTTQAVKQFVNGKDLGDKPVSFGDEVPKDEPKADEPKAAEPTSDPKEDK